MDIANPTYLLLLLVLFFSWVFWRGFPSGCHDKPPPGTRGDHKG